MVVNFFNTFSGKVSRKRIVEKRPSKLLGSKNFVVAVQKSGSVLVIAGRHVRLN
jgi:hypothetical protein